MKKVVHLRVYRGTKILKDENNKVENENNKVALIYDTLEWHNYLKRLVANGFCKVSVEKVLEWEGDKYIKSDIPKNIEEEVEFAHKGDQTVRLTPEQQRIADLEAKIELLMNKDKKLVVEEDDDELAELQSKYEAKFNKKPHHKMGVKKLKEELTK